MQQEKPQQQVKSARARPLAFSLITSQPRSFSYTPKMARSAKCAFCVAMALSHARKAIGEILISKSGLPELALLLSASSPVGPITPPRSSPIRWDHSFWRDRGLKMKNVFLSKTAFFFNSNLRLTSRCWLTTPTSSNSTHSPASGQEPPSVGCHVQHLQHVPLVRREEGAWLSRESLLRPTTCLLRHVGHVSPKPRGTTSPTTEGAR